MQYPIFPLFSDPPRIWREGETAYARTGPRKGQHVTIEGPLDLGEGRESHQVMVRYADNETWAKYPIELSEEPPA
jgi:hypothetical protein